MYAIRVLVDEGLLEVTASGYVGPEEALRAVAQGFALAEAGGISRAVCDMTALTHDASSIVVLGAAFASRFQPGQRMAVVCNPRQLSLCRKLATLSRFGENFGLFTREADARAWLTAASRATHVSPTALRHLTSSEPGPADSPLPVPARAAS